jgi:hypothetical protein
MATSSGDVAPTPWQISGTSILDAKGRLVVLAAGRLIDQPEILAAIAVAREALEALLQLVGDTEESENRPISARTAVHDVLRRARGAATDAEGN